MNKLFIAKVSIHIFDGYDKSEYITETHPVMALSSEDARKKIDKYYDDMSDLYGTRYSVNDCALGELIE